MESPTVQRAVPCGALRLLTVMLVAGCASPAGGEWPVWAFHLMDNAHEGTIIDTAAEVNASRTFHIPQYQFEIQGRNIPLNTSDVLQVVVEVDPPTRVEARGSSPEGGFIRDCNPWRGEYESPPDLVKVALVREGGRCEYRITTTVPDTEFGVTIRVRSSENYTVNFSAQMLSGGPVNRG